jgi:hypothetical protein
MSGLEGEVPVLRSILSLFMMLFLAFSSSALSAPVPPPLPTTPEEAPSEEPAQNAEGSTAASSDVLPGVYRYVDAEGEVHYTNNLSDVPKGTQVAAVKGGTLSEISHHPSGMARPSRPSPNARQAPSQEEMEWREHFGAARREVSRLEAMVNADRRLERQLAPASVYAARCGGAMAPAYGYPQGSFCESVNQLAAVRERLGQEEEALDQARADLDELERRASYEAVPREWRR